MEKTKHFFIGDLMFFRLSLLQNSLTMPDFGAPVRLSAAALALITGLEGRDSS